MPKIQYLYKTRWVIPSIYPQKLGVILQNMNFSRYYRNRGKYIYGFDPNIIEFDDNSSIVLTQKAWNQIIKTGLSVCGYKDKQAIRSINPA